MRKKILMISLATLLIGLVIGLSRVVAQQPGQASVQEALGSTAVEAQAGEQRRHVLGDGVADTPLEVDTLYLRNNLTGGPLETHAGE